MAKILIAAQEEMGKAFKKRFENYSEKRNRGDKITLVSSSMQVSALLAKEKFDGLILQYQLGIKPLEIAEIASFRDTNENMRIAIVVPSSLKGGTYLNQLLYEGILGAVYEEDAKITMFISIIQEGRKRKEAEAYYEIFTPEVTTTGDVNTISSFADDGKKVAQALNYMLNGEDKPVRERWDVINSEPFKISFTDLCSIVKKMEEKRPDFVAELRKYPELDSFMPAIKTEEPKKKESVGLLGKIFGKGKKDKGNNESSETSEAFETPKKEEPKKEEKTVEQGKPEIADKPVREEKPVADVKPIKENADEEPKVDTPAEKPKPEKLEVKTEPRVDEKDKAEQEDEEVVTTAAAANDFMGLVNLFNMPKPKAESKKPVVPKADDTEDKEKDLSDKDYAKIGKEIFEQAKQKSEQVRQNKNANNQTSTTNNNQNNNNQKPNPQKVNPNNTEKARVEAEQKKRLQEERIRREEMLREEARKDAEQKAARERAEAEKREAELKAQNEQLTRKAEERLAQETKALAEKAEAEKKALEEQAAAEKKALEEQKNAELQEKNAELKAKEDAVKKAQAEAERKAKEDAKKIADAEKLAQIEKEKAEEEKNRILKEQKAKEDKLIAEQTKREAELKAEAERMAKEIERKAKEEAARREAEFQRQIEEARKQADIEIEKARKAAEEATREADKREKEAAKRVQKAESNIKTVIQKQLVARRVVGVFGLYKGFDAVPVAVQLAKTLSQYEPVTYIEVPRAGNGVYTRYKLEKSIGPSFRSVPHMIANGETDLSTVRNMDAEINFFVANDDYGETEYDTNSVASMINGTSDNIVLEAGCTIEEARRRGFLNLCSKAIIIYDSSEEERYTTRILEETEILESSGIEPFLLAQSEKGNEVSKLSTELLYAPIRKPAVDQITMLGMKIADEQNLLGSLGLAGAQKLKKKKQSVKVEIIGTRDIAVFGAERGNGVTHTCLMLASSVCRDYRTALIELNPTKHLEAFANEEGRDEGTGRANLYGIDVYYNITWQKFATEFRPKYQIVIIDFGSYSNAFGLGKQKPVENYRNVTTSCAKKYLVFDASPWRLSVLDKMVPLMDGDTDPGCQIEMLAPMTSGKGLKQYGLYNRVGRREIHCIADCEIPVKLDADTADYMRKLVLR